MGDDESRIAGTMIRRHREAAGLTQHDLARAAGVSVGVIRDFEQGRTTRLRPKSADGLRAHIGIGWSLAEQNRYPEALRHSRLAMRLFARASDQHGRAGALNNIGWFHILAGDAEVGIGYCVQARDLFGEIANREGEAIAWDSIGQGQQRLTRHPQAIASFGARCASSATSAISTISPIVSPTSVTPSGTPGSTRPRRDPGVRPWTSWTACPTRPLTGSATACERWADRGVDSGSRS